MNEKQILSLIEEVAEAIQLSPDLNQAAVDSMRAFLKAVPRTPDGYMDVRPVERALDKIEEASDG